MLRTLVATAGHVDHGKTRLIEALTGIDCDRWQEEKDRGITIDLGFAHLVRKDLQIGFVDVPGHERFVHNALAGLGGIGLVLLVVAADEGVQPQTREHSAICSLLGIDRAVVALTKIDLVDDDLRELGTLEVEEHLAETPWAGAPVIPVSAVTGEGLESLEAALLQTARQAAESVPSGGRPVRLPIDRSFHLKGLGAVVTGSLVWGRIAVQQELRLLPLDRAVRIRSLQVHGEDREEAFPGERTSAQISGVDLAELSRGQQLITPESLRPDRRLLARYRLLAEGDELRGWTEIRFHLYSQEVLGRARSLSPEGIAPGDLGLIEIRTRDPVVAVRGDRFVLRRPSPMTTLGGGEILDPAWRRLPTGVRKDFARRLAGDRTEALRAWVELAGEGGTTSDELAMRLGETRGALDDELAGLEQRGHFLSVRDKGSGTRWLAPAVVQRVRDRARRVLERYFDEHRLAEGLSKAEAARRILRGRGRNLAEAYFRWLEAEDVLELRGDRVSLPGRTPELTEEESSLARRIRDRYEAEGLTPGSPTEIAESLGAKPQIFEGVSGYLLERGDLLRLPGGLLLARSVFDRLARDLQESDWERFTVADFKDRFDLSRKWAIPLLEQLDSEGVTRRVGDGRMIR
ncbi:MAG: selenocysteine-specific translation elongation factor [Thermoanaerobaculia bacterium]|nr:selenocysteine-specific translation elongation factor [Thermoanaerobaculia bacterium]